MIVRHRSLAPSFDRGLNRGFDRSFDRAFEQLTNSFFDPRRQAGPTLNGAWSGEEYVITVDLPGVPASAVDVAVRGTVLDIEVAHDEATWTRSVRLGGRLSPDKVEAHHVDGRLTVRIGTHDEPEARSIEISTTQPAIEASSSDTDATTDEHVEADD